MSEHSEIGNEIWKQIQVMVKMSVGARDAVVGDISALIDGDTFQYQIHFNVNKGRRQKVLIGLNGLDLYDIRFVKLSAMGTVKSVFGQFDNVGVYDLNATVLQADRE